MFKIDLHTHSEASFDGGITADQYAKLLEDNILDYIAITDHDEIAFAQNLQKSLGKYIIVGQEITTMDGELIGLFLKKRIQPGQSALQTAQAIHEQDGIVYVPHPFETVRKGLSQTTLDHIAELIDIVEVYNGRAFAQNRGPQAVTWARLNSKPTAASSDAHGIKGIGTAYTILKEAPTAKNLSVQMYTAHLHMTRPPLKTLLYPKVNRFLKKLGRK